MCNTVEELLKLFLDLENNKDNLTNEEYLEKLEVIEKKWASLVLLGEVEEQCMNNVENLGIKIGLAIDMFFCKNELLFLRKQISI